MGNPFEKIEPPEASKEQEESAEQWSADLTECLAGHKAAADAEQEELNQLLGRPREERDNVKIQALEQKLKEIHAYIAELEDGIEVINEDGDEEWEIEPKKKKLKE